MSFLGKKYVNKLFLLLLTFFVGLSLFGAGQVDGLTAAREKEQQGQTERKGYVKKQLAPEIMEKIEEERKKVRPRSRRAAGKPAETKTLSEINKPVTATIGEEPTEKPEQPTEGQAEKEVATEQPTEGEVSATISGAEAAGEEEEEEGDRYVQTVAHLQLEDVQHRMADFLQQPIGFIPKEGELLPAEKTPNEMVTPYLNVIAKAIDREIEFKDTHYVFYHGMSNAWRVVQDFYKQLYAYFNPLQPVKDFTFVRFTDMPTIKAQDYLSQAVAEFAGVNDNILDVRTRLLPVNLALFGNVGFPGECTWNYFLSPKSHLIPLPEENIQPILDGFGLKYDLDSLVEGITELTEMLAKASPEQTILQIFIPQEQVDDVAYLAWIIGFPAHAKSMELIESIFEGKPKVGGMTGPAVKKVMKMYKREGEDNPLYKDLLDAVENGDFGAEAFLKVYRNNPSELKNVNDTQARLVITNDVLLNPKSGVKFFSLFTTPKEIQDQYVQKLNALVKKIIEKNKHSRNTAPKK